MSDWCILRTAGRSTLPLVKSLAEAGYEVWTPSAVPLKIPRRRRKTEDEPRAAMTPTYVFARARHVFELIALASSPTRNHEGFTVFHTIYGIPLVTDKSLNGLRAEEDRLESKREEQARRQRSKGKGEAFPIGETVRIPDGSFAGMDGMVAESDARHTIVLFGGSMRLKISTFILRENELSCADNPAVGAAA